MKITLNHITKIEGHASLNLKIKDSSVEICELSSTEGARFFESLLCGRNIAESQEITSRICGICSCVHTVCSLKVVENAIGIKVSKQTSLLRELLLLGERIRSHATHLYFFALPDYLGCESALEIAAKNREKIEDALALIKLGNLIAETVGGREMHPFTCVLGGFTHIPKQEKIDLLLNELKENRDKAIKTLKLFSEIKYPTFENEIEHLCIKKGSQYPLLEGEIVSDKQFKKEQKKYSEFIEEKIENYSTGKFVVKKGGEYRVGALSRLNNCYSSLNESTKKEIKKIEVKKNNPFHNNLAQAVELLDSIEIAIQIIKNNKFKGEPIPEIKPKAGRGIAVVEAPRGVLIHDYKINKEGVIEKANIITPTCQNLRAMEADIKGYVSQLIREKISHEKLVLEIEKLIRSYDPCFSCSTHFLKVNWL